MKIFYNYLRWILFLGMPLISWAAITANLDETFGNAGIVVDDVVASSADYPNAITIDASNRILIAGKITSDSDSDFFVQRYNSTGVLDTSFGADGTATVNFDTSIYEAATDIAVLADGSILVAGATPDDFALARFNDDGSLNTEFGVEGKVSTDFNSGTDYAYALLADDSGIFIFGSSDGDVAIAKYDDVGNLDTHFGDDGILTINIGGHDVGLDAAFTSDGNIVIAGTTTLISDDSCDDCSVAESSDIVLIKINSSGLRIGAFGGGDGIVTTNIDSTDNVSAVAIQDDGKIIVAGTSLIRYTTSGLLDASFGGDGHLPLSEIEASALAITADGDIVVAGYVTNTSKDFAFSVYNSSAALNTNLGNDGVVSVDINDSSDDYPSAASLDNEGNLTLAGRTESGDEIDAALMRFKVETATSSQNENTQSSAGGCSLVDTGRYKMSH